MKIKYIFLAVGLATVVVWTTSSGRSSAEGITIAPISQELSITASTAEETGSFFVTNRGDQPQTYRVRAIDIDASDSSGGIVLLSSSSPFQRDHGLVQWLTVEQPLVTVGSQETKEVTFKIANSSELRPGGHYGALIAETVNGLDQEAVNKVSLSPQAAALVFVKKIGGEKYSLDLKSAKVASSLTGISNSADLVFENGGDVHVVPRGVIVVADSFGREVARGAINVDSALVLPGKNRRLIVELRGLAKGLTWPGRYTATVAYRFDGKTDFQGFVTHFWVINLPLLLASLLVLALTVFVLYRYRRAVGRFLRYFWRLLWAKFGPFRVIEKVMHRLVVIFRNK